MKILEMTRDMAISHPLYMKAPNPNGASFTSMEKNILSLLELGRMEKCDFKSVKYWNFVIYILKIDRKM